jgi:23S rRNA pseudouridine2605 synthase
MPDTPRSDKSGERIAKVMARAGLASRREAEAWIAAGRVSVNGAVITSPALNVSSRDVIAVDGEPMRTRERTRLFLYNKPPGLVTTHFDPEGRPTIFGALPKDLPRVISVGRLDLTTEGLLLLTNDGGLARALELPSTGWLRRYRVRAFGRGLTQQQLDGLRDGITVDGIRYGAIEATLERQQGANVWLSFAIREGKNREVRNVLRSLDLHVNRLIRVSYGPFTLDDLPEGAVREVDTPVLKTTLGPEIVKAAQCDFTAPVFDHHDSDAMPARERKGREKERQHERREYKPERKAERSERNERFGKKKVEERPRSAPRSEARRDDRKRHDDKRDAPKRDAPKRGERRDSERTDPKQDTKPGAPKRNRKNRRDRTGGPRPSRPR